MGADRHLKALQLLVKAVLHFHSHCLADGTLNSCKRKSSHSDNHFLRDGAWVCIQTAPREGEGVKTAQGQRWEVGGGDLEEGRGCLDDGRLLLHHRHQSVLDGCHLPLEDLPLLLHHLGVAAQKPLLKPQGPADTQSSAPRAPIAPTTKFAGPITSGRNGQVNRPRGPWISHSKLVRRRPVYNRIGLSSAPPHSPPSMLSVFLPFPPCSLPPRTNERNANPPGPAD